MRTFKILARSVAVLLIAAGSVLVRPVSALSADETFAAKLNSENVFGIGLQAGLSTGSGLSFRFHPAGRMAFEVTAGYITLDDPMGSVGAEINFDLSTSENTRVYALGGASVNYIGKDGSNSLDAPWRAGLGVGFEWFFAERVALAGELPITVFFESPLGVLPLPQLQFMFFFQ